MKITKSVIISITIILSLCSVGYTGEKCSGSISVGSSNDENCTVCSLWSSTFDWPGESAKRNGYLCGVDIQYLESEGFRHEIDERTNYNVPVGNCALYDGKKVVWIKHIPTNSPDGGRYKTKVCYYYKWGKDGELCNSCEPCNSLDWPPLTSGVSSSYSKDCVKQPKNKNKIVSKKCDSKNMDFDSKDCSICSLWESSFDWDKKCDPKSPDYQKCLQWNKNVRTYGYICGVDVKVLDSKGFTWAFDNKTNYGSRVGKCTLYDGKKSVWIGYTPTDSPDGGRFETKVCFYYKWGVNGKLCNTCEPCNDIDYPNILNAYYYDSYSGDCVSSKSK